MNDFADAVIRKDFYGLALVLLHNIEAVGLHVERFGHSPIHPHLVSFTRAINVFSRKEFLARLHSVLTRDWHLKAEIVCSIGAGLEGTRRATLRGAACDSAPDERLILNLYGVSPEGNLIPLVVLDGGEPELEGIINVAPSPDAQRDETREKLLHAAAQIIALAFRNVKISSALMENCPRRVRGRLSGILGGYRGDSGKFAADLAAFLGTEERPTARKHLQALFGKVLRFILARRYRPRTLVRMKDER